MAGARGGPPSNLAPDGLPPHDPLGPTGWVLKENSRPQYRHPSAAISTTGSSWPRRSAAATWGSALNSPPLPVATSITPSPSMIAGRL